MTLREEKQALRRELLALRRGLPGREEKDAAICRQVTALEEWRQAARVLFYLSTPEEADTWALVRLALQEGKEAFAPVCGPADGQMAFFRFDSLSQLHRGRWGIWEPAGGPRAPVHDGRRAICLAPGIAFDREGRRLGYGKGYYDRFFAAGRYHIKTVGLCYQALFRDSLPGEEHDQRVGLVATEAGVFPCARKG